MDGVKLHYQLDNIEGQKKQCINYKKKLVERGIAREATKFPYVNPDFKSDQVLLSHVKDRLTDACRTSFLNPDPNVFDDVRLIHFKSLDKFYVRHYKFETCLKELEKEMSMSVQQPVIKLQEGLICALRVSKEPLEFNRVKIIRIWNEKEVDVFYLDYGETYTEDVQDNFFHLDIKLIKRVPFQAIPCKLLDFSGKVNENLVYDLTRSEDNYFRPVLCKRFSSDSEVASVALYLKHHEDSYETVYHHLGKLLIDAAADIKRTGSLTVDVITMKKSVVCSGEGDSDSEDEYRGLEDVERGCLDKMLKPLLGNIAEMFKKVTADDTPGIVSRKTFNHVDDETDTEEEKEESYLCKVPANYFSGDFDAAEAHRNDLPKGFDPDDLDEETAESDDDINDLDDEGKDSLFFPQ